MKITFIGAAHEVTGSCTLIEVGNRKILIDFGLEQGKDIFENQPVPVSAAEIDYVFLTHAHMDHAGKLPLLYKNGFTGNVYATHETKNLCMIMLKDGAHIQASEAEYRTRKAKRAGKPPVEPLYDAEHVYGIMKLMCSCNYGEQLRIDENITVRFTDIGHLLGSACVELWLTENGETRKIVFSGDVGNINQPIINDPQKVADADYVMIESTYGDRLHNVRRGQEHIDALASDIQRTLDRGGNLIIPAFAVGRTQELLYFIREIVNNGMIKGHDGFPVYVDSPLANEATAVFAECSLQCLDSATREVVARGENPIVFPGLHKCITTEESKKLNTDPTPKIIISASGMCDAGRIRHHLKNNLWRKESTILFVGYQSNGTIGRQIVDGAKTVKLFGDEIAVNAEIALFPGISGHADKKGLLDWLSGFEKKPQLVFVNHGEADVCDSFVKCLKEEYGINAYAPYSGTEFDLLSGKLIHETHGIPVKKLDELSKEYDRARSAANSVLSLVSDKNKLPANKWAQLAEKLEELISEYKK